MLWAIWCHLHNLINVKNTHGWVLLLVNLQTASLLNVTLFNGCFLRFLNRNGTQSAKTSHMYSFSNYGRFFLPLKNYMHCVLKWILHYFEDLILASFKLGKKLATFSILEISRKIFYKLSHIERTVLNKHF